MRAYFTTNPPFINPAYGPVQTWTCTRIHKHTRAIHIYIHAHTYTHHKIEGKALPQLKDKNKAASVKWYGMSEEEKQRYYQLAVQVPSISSPSHNNIIYNKWHETQRVLCNLQENVRFKIPTLLQY